MIYAYYQDDELICVGTAKEVAQFTNTKVKSIIMYASPSWHSNSSNVKVIKWREINSSNYDVTEDV